MRQTKPLIVNTVADFLAHVSSVAAKWSSESDDTVDPWFRGQQKDHWELVPKLYREHDTKDAVDVEDEIRESFSVRAPDLIERVPANEWEWYFLMQHFGASTRLLDWTEGALIGLYFAIRDNQGYQNAAVWMLNPWWLNKRVVGEYEVLPPGDPGVLQKDLKRYEPWLRGRFKRRARLPRLPVAVYPSHTSRRISSQRSCFTIHGSDTAGLDRLARRKNTHLVKLVVPSFKVQEIRRTLETCGLDEVTVFPDLQGLGRSVTASWQEDRLDIPHQHVYARLGRSKLHGVGVFAIRRIKKGMMPFRDDGDEMIWIDRASIRRLPREIRKLYDEFAIIKNDRYACPPSFNRLTVSWYLNDSKKPNMRCDENYDFMALRNIKLGEELTVDYSTFSEHPRGRQARMVRK